MSDRYAFVDESYIVATRHYLLAAVVVREEMLDDVRASVRAVRRRRRDAFHGTASSTAHELRCSS